MEKLFYCIWTYLDNKAINSYDPAESEEKSHFFTEDNGYTIQDITVINRLDKGEAYSCEYGNHNVKRIR